MEDFNFKKKYGQNFLSDENLVNKIARCALIKPNSLTIEVGPGKGILTNELIKYSTNVISYEIDLDLEQYLKKRFENVDNLEIIYGDFLKRNISDDINKYKYDNIYFVSNVPYYITSPILLKLIDTKIPFEKIVMMVQEELGERLSASPKTKSYGSITVLLNYFYDIKREFKVNRNMFKPVPNVDSEVISLTRKQNIKKAKNEDLLFRLIRDSFKYKRKTIKNNLSNYDLVIVEKVLKRYGYGLSVRAEQLPIEIFVEISDELY